MHQRRFQVSQAEKGLQDIGDRSVTLGTADTWNIADGYVKFKVLRHLIMIDRLHMIALYGNEDIDELNLIPQEMLTQRRIDALFRLKDTIEQLITNVTFILKAEDKPKIEDMRNRLNLIGSMLDATHAHKEDQISHDHALIIYEEWFRKMVAELRQIAEELNTPINKVGLIFKRSDEMDIDTMANDIVFGG